MANGPGSGATIKLQRKDDEMSTHYGCSSRAAKNGTIKYSLEWYPESGEFPWTRVYLFKSRALSLHHGGSLGPTRIQRLERQHVILTWSITSLQKLCASQLRASASINHLTGVTVTEWSLRQRYCTNLPETSAHPRVPRKAPKTKKQRAHEK